MFYGGFAISPLFHVNGSWMAQFPQDLFKQNSSNIIHFFSILFQVKDTKKIETTELEELNIWLKINNNQH